jgi:hypothetical protein
MARRQQRRGREKAATVVGHSWLQIGLGRTDRGFITVWSEPNACNFLILIFLFFSQIDS